jgi:hypothetical protein
MRKPTLYHMKKLFMLLTFVGVSFLSFAQTGDKPACDKTSCGPEGTKTAEAKSITTLRSDLETVITKMAKSTVPFDKNVSSMKITKGSTDDECLLYISQAATSVRHELVSKLEPSKLIPSLKKYEPIIASNKQQMMASLKKEIEVLADQADKL